MVTKSIGRGAPAVHPNIRGIVERRAGRAVRKSPGDTPLWVEPNNPGGTGHWVNAAGFFDLVRAFLREKPEAKINNQSSMKGRDSRQANE